MTQIAFTRSETGGPCPDCGYQIAPGEVNTHMQQHVAIQRGYISTPGVSSSMSGRDVYADLLAEVENTIFQATYRPISPDEVLRLLAATLRELAKRP